MLCQQVSVPEFEIIIKEAISTCVSCAEGFSILRWVIFDLVMYRWWFKKMLINLFHVLYIIVTSGLVLCLVRAPTGVLGDWLYYFTIQRFSLVTTNLSSFLSIVSIFVMFLVVNGSKIELDYSAFTCPIMTYFCLTDITCPRHIFRLKFGN